MRLRSRPGEAKLSKPCLAAPGEESFDSEALATVLYKGHRFHIFSQHIQQAAPKGNQVWLNQKSK